METKVAAIAPAPDPGTPRGQSSVQTAPGGAAPAAAEPEPVDLRLVIEEDQATGSYVYKTINRATGEVLQQLPRAEVLKLKGELKYAAGTIVRTKA
jgi:flagellar protein FlaG